MKNKKIILTVVIIFLFISLIGIIIYNNKNKILTTEGKILAVGSNYLLVGLSSNEDYVVNTNDTNYQVGDKIKLELTNINKNKIPYEGTAKEIIIIETTNIIEDSENNQSTISDNKDFEVEDSNEETIPNIQNTNDTSNNNEEYSESDMVVYFQNLDNDLTTYNNNDDSLEKTIKSNFVKCIDFLFYGEEIGGKTFSELTDTTKLKILEITLSIDYKIDSHFPGYKEDINNTYQNIKSKIITSYLETTTNICNNDEILCQNAKEGFKKLKDNFGITWNLIKDLASTGVSKLKDWYEIWRYN